MTNPWRARVEFNSLSMQYEISLLRRGSGDRDEVVVGVEESGGLILREADPGVRLDPFLFLDLSALEAIESALDPFRKAEVNEVVVETLSEILAYERQRVDNVLDRLLPEPRT